MKTKENNSSIVAWIILLIVVLCGKNASASIQNYHISIHSSVAYSQLSEVVQEEIWKSYIKIKEGSWINYSFRDSNNNQLNLIENSKYLSNQLLAFFNHKGIENKNLIIQYTPTASLVVHKEKGGNKNANFIELDPINLQIFEINNRTGGSCLTDGGNKIVFPEKAFKCAEDAVVTIELYEMLTRKDFVKTGYTSTSRNKNLVSNGMYEISAKHNDNNVELRTGKSAEIHFQANNFQQQKEANTFHSFYGKQEKNIIDWIPNYHEKVSGNVPKSSFLSDANRNLNNGNYKSKKTVIYTEILYLQLCRKIASIDQEIYRSMKNCTLTENTYKDVLKKYGKLQYLNNGKFTAIESYQEYLRKNKKRQDDILIGLNQSQTEKFKQNELKEQQEIQNIIDAANAENEEYESLSEEEQAKLDKKEKEQFPVMMKISQLGSINCDRFDNNQNKTDVIVRLNDYNYDKIKVYAVFNDIKSVIHGYYRPEHRGVIKFNSLPEGENVTYLAATFKGDEIKLAYLNKNIKADDWIDMNLTSYSKEQYNRILDDLIPN